MISLAKSAFFRLKKLPLQWSNIFPCGKVFSLFSFHKRAILRSENVTAEGKTAYRNRPNFTAKTGLIMTHIYPKSLALQVLIAFGTRYLSEALFLLALHGFGQFVK